MYPRKSRFVLLTAGLLVRAASAAGAKNYSVGTIFNDIIQFDFRSGEFQVPLPPGDWKLVSNNEYSSGGDAFAIAMTRLVLLRHTDTLVTGAIQINLPKDIIDSHWRESSTCSSRRKRFAWYVKDDSFDRNEYCTIVYPIRGFRRNSRNLQTAFKYIEDMNLTGPNSWVLARFYRTRGTDLLYVNLSLPQEHYGFPRERKWSNTESPWSINNIGAHPKKKSFMTRTVSWAKSWQELIDRGFRNKLTRAEILTHPRIDGSAAPSNNRTPNLSGRHENKQANRTPVQPSLSEISKPDPAPNPLRHDMPLNAELIKKLLVGSTAQGEGTRANNVLRFEKSGQLEGMMELGNTDYFDHGQWSVRDKNRLCLKWNNEEIDQSACFVTTRQKNTLLFQNSNGRTAYSIDF